MDILVNLPEGFFVHPDLADTFARLGRLGDVRKTSHNRAEEIAADLARAEAVLMWSWPLLTDDLLDAAPRLRYRGHLDINQAGAKIALTRSVPVSVSRAGFSPAVSEMALALILNSLRRVSDYHAAMRTGEETWVKAFPGDIDRRERELTGRPVGIVGFGRVGQRLAQLLAPFGCPLLVVDPYVPDAVLARFEGARRVELPEMLEMSDVVVLCAASNEGTRHLLGREEIARLRPDAVLVNVARAALVDTEALAERLRRGDLFAALDVFDKEPLEADSPLRGLPNAYLTPHRAGGVIASVQRCVGWLVDDLEAVLAGRPQQYPLTEGMLPSLDEK
jgi:Phosphoglycerate dehydrogenase and related dehydrogenases